MGRDLKLWTSYDYGSDHRLVRDVIHLDREASFHAFMPGGNEGLVIKPERLRQPVQFVVPDPQTEDGSRTISNIRRDAYNKPLTFVRPEAFKDLKGEGSYNERAYRLIEGLTGSFVVILYWH